MCNSFWCLLRQAKVCGPLFLLVFWFAAEGTAQITTPSCQARQQLDFTVASVPDAYPSLPSVQVNRWSRVQLSARAKMERVSTNCDFTIDLVPLSWSLMFRPCYLDEPGGCIFPEIDISSSLAPPTEQTLGSPSVTSFEATERGTYRVRVRAGLETREVLIESLTQIACDCYTDTCPRPGDTCKPLPKPCGSCAFTTKSGDPSLVNDGYCSNDWSPLKGYGIVRNDVAKSIELWFSAYIATGKGRRAGMPDESLIKQALEVSLPVPAQRAIRDTVFSALDYTIGFDFLHPHDDCLAYDAACMGQFRIALAPAGVKLLESVREGFIDTLQNGDVSRFDGQLRKFWHSNPKYAPFHTGRCYPHGHTEYTRAGLTPLTCQSSGLSKWLKQILSGTTPSSVR